MRTIFSFFMLFVLSSFAYSQEGDSVVISKMQVVDLGLSVDWAGYNIGATAPEESGNFYSWGEKEPKNSYYRSHYLHCKNNVVIDLGESICGSEYDAATAAWGDGWRLPTTAEVEELRDECDWAWITYNGVQGCRVTGPSGNSIFLPAVGIFWGAKKQGVGEEGWYWIGDCAADKDCAKIIYFEASRYTPEFLAIMDIIDPITEAKKIGGQTIRAVREHSDASSCAATESDNNGTAKGE